MTYQPGQIVYVDLDPAKGNDDPVRLLATLNTIAILTP